MVGRLPLGTLQGFVLTARSGSLSLAAARMHVTASALSHQIRRLEERCDRRLFVRGAHGLRLTEEGQRLLDTVGPSLDTVEHAMRQFRPRSPDALALSVLPSLATAWLVPRLPAFCARHPVLRLSLQSSSRLIDFEHEPFEAGIRYGAGQWADLRAEHLFDEWLVPVASPALVAKLGRPSPEALAQWPLLHDSMARWEAWFKSVGCEAPDHYVATFDDLDTLHRAAIEGMGVALGRLTLARPLIESGHLALLIDRPIRAPYAHYLVYPARSERHPSLVVFREWLMEEARRFRALPALAAPRHTAPAASGAGDDGRPG